MVQDIRNWKVNKEMCPTCPFQANGDPEIRFSVMMRCINNSQICHHPRLHGKKETCLCRGARNHQLQIFHRMGFIEAPTDEAWEKVRKEHDTHRKE